MRGKFFIALAAAVLASASAFSQQGKFTFSSVDLNGAKVSSDIFSEADITVVNVWGTFCPPCIREMPELGKWAASMPRSARLVGIVSDATSARDTAVVGRAKEILKWAKADFTNIPMDKGVADSLNSVCPVQFVPTTIFIDRSGRMVGEPVVGANVYRCRKFVEEYLSKRGIPEEGGGRRNF